MSRKINISKYEGNTHYSVCVIDSYGTEHHLGYYNNLYASSIQAKADEIWANEVKPEVDLMANAIKEMIEIDKKNGLEPNLD